MRKSFDRLRGRASASAPALASRVGSALGRDPRTLARAALGLMLAANLAAALLVWRPIGGSPEQLEQQLADLRRQSTARQAAIGRLRTLAAKVDKARAEGDKFLAGYFMDRRTASSSILAELARSAREAGLKPREHSFLFEPVEGSDTLSLMRISANYEGTYADLVEFVNLLDRSARFLILENLQAAPQQTAGMLNAGFQINTFVREAQAEP